MTSALAGNERMRDDGHVVLDEVDIINLGLHSKNLLLHTILKLVEEDNDKFLRRVRARLDRYVLFVND